MYVNLQGVKVLQSWQAGGRGTGPAQGLRLIDTLLQGVGSAPLYALHNDVASSNLNDTLRYL